MFRKYIIIFGIMAALLLSLSLLAKNNQERTDRTDTASETIDIDNFSELQSVNEIELKGNYTTNIEQSESPYLSIKGKGKNNLDVYVEDNRLIIQHKDKRYFNFKTTDIEITIKLPNINKIQTNGVTVIQNSQPIKGDKLDVEFNGVGSLNLSKLDFESIKVSVSGTGEIEMNGTTNTLFLELEGVGSINTQNLKAYKCIAKNNGIGSISLYAENELSAYIEGLGSIEYLGNPKIRKNISGLGSINRID